MPLPAFILSEIEQAAGRNGYPADPVMRDGWLVLRSPWTAHELLAGHNGARFVVATFAASVAAEARRAFPPWSGPLPAGAAGAFTAEGGSALHALIGRLYRLALSLPPEPLRQFEAKAAGLPRGTEAERLVVQRIGQDEFRRSLMDYWGGRCPLTGLDQPELLRASHIKPWADCETDAERLDVFNGLLLAAHLDAAFDAALISFTDEGELLASERLSPAARAVLRLETLPTLAGLTPAHCAYLAGHRDRLLTG